VGGAAGLIEGLADAAAGFQDEPTIVGLAAEALSRLAPGCVASAYTIHGRAVGVRRLRASGGELPDDPEFRRLFASVYLPVDRLALRHGGRWINVVHDGLLPSAEVRRNMDRLPSMRRFRIWECGFFAVGLGAIPLATGNLKLPEGERPFSDDQKGRLRAAARRMSTPLRIASLLAGAAAGLSAVDHLLSHRADAVFLVSPAGRVLGASPRAEHLLLLRPALLDAIGHAARSCGARALSLPLPSLDLELHASPCSERGRAPALFVTVGENAAAGRGRFTVRQAELFDLMAQGLSNKEIAERMCIAAGSVKTMLERLYRRAGVSGRVALLRWARSRAA